MIKTMIAIALAAGCAIGSANAQSFPSRPITILVPLAAGGSTDTIGRIMAEGMRPHLGQPVIVENSPGAGGSTGVIRVARSAPDGYLVQIGQWGTNVAGGAVYDLPIDLLKDLEPVGLISTQPFMIVGKKTLPPNNFKELIAWLKANPNKATAATIGAGSGTQLCLIYLQQNTGTQFQLVPYRGTAPIFTDLLAGHVDLTCPEAGQTLALYRSGKIKAYAVMDETRWFAAPDVPTTDEAGAPGLHMTFWYGLWAPAGTPRDIIAKLNAAVVETFADPGVRARLTEEGHVIPTREQLTPEALGAHHKAEIEKWWPMIKAAGIKIQ